MDFAGIDYICGVLNIIGDMEREISNALAEVNPQLFKSLIHEFRGTLVMLDADLAAIYGYSTSTFNLQVKRNIERFDEEDLMFQLTEEEFRTLMLQNEISSVEQDSSKNGDECYRKDYICCVVL